jgi:succinate-semialdehyde dehydrogenase/glutarate-semialdehyde dehydrogenase
MIIRADADPVRAAAIAERACFANSGQLCISMERIYVHEAVVGAFLQEFAQRARAMTMIPHVGWGASIGSLISQSQVDRFVSHVEDAVTRSARVVTGGHARPDVGPFYVEPTILTDVDETMLVCRTETFGPLVSVYPVGSDDEAIERANDTSFGLNAAVITRDRKTGATLARRLHSGSVNVNEGYASSWASVRAPTGGWADSGLGSRHGDEAVHAVTRVQNIATQRAFGFDPQFGMSDERWAATLTTAIGLIKKIGMK